MRSHEPGRCAFLGGLIDSIFGGGGDTTVTQAATNKTDVTVTSQIANVIDLSLLAEAVKSMGQSVQGAISATGQQTQALIAQLGQAQVLTALANAQEQAKQNELLGRGLDMAKFAAIAVAGYFVWRKLL